MIRKLARVHGVPAREALAVSQAENGTRQCDRESKPNRDGSIDYGLFQINSIHLSKGYTVSELKDCYRNIEIAFEIYKQSGWHPWTVYKTGRWKKYLLE